MSNIKIMRFNKYQYIVVGFNISKIHLFHWNISTHQNALWNQHWRGFLGCSSGLSRDLTSANSATSGSFQVVQRKQYQLFSKYVQNTNLMVKGQDIKLFTLLNVILLEVWTCTTKAFTSASLFAVLDFFFLYLHYFKA